MSGHWGAFVNEHFTSGPAKQGRLDGLSFAVKDVFAVKGHTNTAGNPDWLRTHGPAEGNAAVIDALLEQGAILQGITHTDELMFSLNGENWHYGTPVNPSAPGRIPGGSSSGSAVAAAAGLADFALGTDTAGSVRVPSAYCGIYGIRPTHGIVSVDGVIPLSPAFDTVGWMSRDIQVMLDVALALMPDSGRDKAFSRLYVPDDVWELAEEPYRSALSGHLPPFAAACIRNERITLAPEGLSVWFTAFRTIQGYEIWDTHGDWINRVRPRFGPDIAERFAWASTLKREDFERQLAVRRAISGKMAELLGDDGLLVIPTASSVAPETGVTGEESDRRRLKSLQLSCLAGLSGLPQVTVPIGEAGGLPAGLSFIAGPHQDIRLLTWIRRIMTNQAAFSESRLP